jgi:RNase P subunit RPR2
MKNIFDTMQAITKLAKAGMTLELQEKIAELREQTIILKEDNARLKEENLRLRQELEHFTKGALCPKCRQPSWILEGSKPHPTFGDLGALEITYTCTECGYSEKRIDEGGIND